MMNMKKVIVGVTMTLILGTAIAAYAAEYKTPAEIVAGLTGKTATEVANERASGKTYGTIASEAGKLGDYKAEILKERKALLDERVKNGGLTQEKADEIYNAIKDNQATCDGTGSAHIGQKYGAGFGCGNGIGMGSEAGVGKGTRRGSGQGNGMGRGTGIRNDSGTGYCTGLGR